MFFISAADYAFVTTEEDTKAKNIIPPSFSYTGMDLEKTGIPGLYWINIFSEELAQWLDLEHFPKELAAVAPIGSGGFTLEFCESPDECRDADVLRRQQIAIEWLGQERFFDLRRPERKAVTPDWCSMPLPIPK